MVFDVIAATSQSSLNQLFQAYKNAWYGMYTIEILYNLWYYIDTPNSTIVKCRMYYKFTGSATDYWNADIDYDTTSGLYNYIFRSGNPASSTSNGLDDNVLQQLTLFYPTNIPCFKEDTKILTNKGYIHIQDLRKGDLVKTLKDDFKQIVMIGKREIFHHALQERNKDQLYKCSQSEYSEIFEPLIITGCHSILVDNFTSEEQKNKVIKLLGNKYVTDDKYKLPACCDHRASVYEKQGIYNIYHLALENNDYYMNYGIYANGLLVETCSIRYLKELSNMTLIE
jgi:hypothetical protein